MRMAKREMRIYNIRFIPSKWFSEELHNQPFKKRIITTIIPDNNDSIEAGRWLYLLKRLYVEE